MSPASPQPAARHAGRRLLAAVAVSTLALTGCYVLPMGPDGTPYYPPGAPVMLPPAPANAIQAPTTLNVRLYPANDMATGSGVLTGTVSNLMNGRGRFQFNYQGDTLVGEATRVSGDERRGIASAYGSRGTHASCEYQMSSPTKGAGHCSFSNGAKYNVHIGS